MNLHSNVLLCGIIIASTAIVSIDGFSLVKTSPITRTKAATDGTAISMIVGPNQMLAMEKRKNPKKFESTIQGLMKSKKISRAQAEKRYGDFLLDPDGFALRAAAEERSKLGYKDWKEQAIARSDDPEAARKRIDAFQARNSIKGTAIIVLFFTAVVVYGQMNPYVPPV